MAYRVLLLVSDGIMTYRVILSEITFVAEQFVHLNPKFRQKVHHVSYE